MSCLRQEYTLPSSEDEGERGKTDEKDGVMMWKNVATGLCLDVRDGVSYHGANLMTYSCTGTPNQLWRVEEIR